MSSWRQILLKNLTHSLLVVTLLLFVFGSGFILNPAIQTSNLRTLLSVMVGAQASILAIVISVTLISTQLVATRYAPRMAKLPFRTPLFRGTFLLFAISIIIDVVLLLTVTPATTPFYSGGLFLAVGLFFSILVFLYFFVRDMVGHTSPENLVTLFTNTISVEEYLSRSQALAKAPEQNAHPLQRLYRFIMSALSAKEHGTARAALDQYQQYSLRIMQELDAIGVFQDNSLKCQKQLFGPVLTDHLHSITIHAAKQNESDILDSAISTQIDLGKEGIKVGGRNQIPGQALRGIRRTIIETPVTPDDYVTFNRTWLGVSELMLAEVQYDQNSVLLSGRNVIEQRLTSTLKRSNDPLWHSSSLREFFDNLSEAHIWSLKKLAFIPGFDHIDLTHDPITHDMPMADFVYQVQYSIESIIAATSTFLQFRIEEGFWPATAGNFRREWKQMCISAASYDAEDHAVWLCQMIIEMAFIENINRPYDQDRTRQVATTEDGETDHLYWETELAEIHRETSSPVVERAFKNILEYEYQQRQEQSLRIRIAGEDTGEEEQYYFMNLSLQETRALNTYQQFPEVVQELRKGALQE